IRRGLREVLAEPRLSHPLHVRGGHRRQLSRRDRCGGCQATAVAGRVGPPPRGVRGNNGSGDPGGGTEGSARGGREGRGGGGRAVLWLRGRRGAPGSRAVLAQEAAKPQWVVALADEADTLDPPSSPAFTAEQYMFHVYDGLTGVEGKDLKPVGLLAE